MPKPRTNGVLTLAHVGQVQVIAADVSRDARDCLDEGKWGSAVDAQGRSARLYEIARRRYQQILEDSNG